jgi:hypothetical protein
MVRAMASVPALSRLQIVISAMPEEMVRRDYPGYAAFLQKPFRLTKAAALLSRLPSDRAEAFVNIGQDLVHVLGDDAEPLAEPV